MHDEFRRDISTNKRDLVIASTNTVANSRRITKLEKRMNRLEQDMLDQKRRSYRK